MQKKHKAHEYDLASVRKAIREQSYKPHFKVITIAEYRHIWGNGDAHDKHTTMLMMMVYTAADTRGTTIFCVRLR